MVGECDECGEEAEMSMCPECESVLCKDCLDNHSYHGCPEEFEEFEDEDEAS